MKKLVLFLLVASVSWGALSVNTIFEVNSAGANTNGACFVEGSSGTDNTYPTPTVTTYTDLVIDAVTNTKVTSAAFPFDANSPGRCLRITSGTGFTTGLYYVVSQAAGVATLDRAVGTVGSTGGNGKSGGALLTLAQLNTDMCISCRAYVKADGTYSITAKVTFNYTNTSGTSWIAGYTTTRGDNGKFTLQAGSNFADRMIDTNVGNMFALYNVKMDANNQSTITCFRFLAQQNQARNLECLNFNNSTAQFTFNNQRNFCYLCWAHNGTSGGNVFLFSSIADLCWGCVVQDVAGANTIAFNVTEGFCTYCVVDTLSGATSDAFSTANAGPLFIDHAVVYSVTRDGLRITTITNSLITIQNSIIEAAANAINNTSGTTLQVGDFYNDYNFTFNSGSACSGCTAGTHSVALSGTPFTDAANSNFTLNNTAGAGASVRTAGTPSSLPGVTGTGFPDGGILQTQTTTSSTGGSVVVP